MHLSFSFQYSAVRSIEVAILWVDYDYSTNQLKDRTARGSSKESGLLKLFDYL